MATGVGWLDKVLGGMEMTVRSPVSLLIDWVMVEDHCQVGHRISSLHFYLKQVLWV